MAALSREEQALLERLRQAKAAQDWIAPAQRKPIRQPDKYVNPIGMDEAGNFFPDPHVETGGG
jgi:hypothetical protein